MIETLIITVIILSLALLGLVGYIIYLTKKTKNFDINNEPEFAKLQERNIKSEEYISELKKDKEQLIENKKNVDTFKETANSCLLYTSPSPRDGLLSRMPSSA